MKKIFAAAMVLSTLAFVGGAGASGELGVMASDQDVSGGSVMADNVMAAAPGWLVVHRTDAAMKPGPVVGHAALAAGDNKGVTAALDEPVKSGEMLMLMLHGEEGGMKPGVFEYTLGAKEDGPVKVNGKLVMQVITAK